MSRTVATRVINGVPYRIARVAGGYAIQAKLDGRWMPGFSTYVYLAGAKSKLAELVELQAN